MNNRDNSKAISILKFLTFSLFFAVFMMIMMLTFQKSSETLALSSTITSHLKTALVQSGISFRDIAWVNEGNVRRLAHVCEYFVLGVTALFALTAVYRNYFYTVPSSLVVCALVSYGDQLIKGVLPTREFDYVDLYLDLLGYVMGICVALIVLLLGKLVISSTVILVRSLMTKKQ